jgi:hypothetical protein
LECEVRATTGAMSLAKKVSKRMYDRLAASLTWYLNGTPAPAKTRARARELTAPLAFYSQRPARLKFEMREERQRRVNAEIQKERLRCR